MAIPLHLQRSQLTLGAILLLAVHPTVTNAAGPKSGVESLLTPETVGFLHVRVADVWDSPNAAFYRKMFSSLGAEETKAFDGKFAPNPSNIESLTVIMPSTNIRMSMPDGRPVGESMLWVITTKQAIDRSELIKGLGLEVRTKAHHGTDYFFDEAHWAGVILIDPSTLVVGAEDSILRLIEQRESARQIESPLAKVFARESNKHATLLGVTPATLATPEILNGMPEPLKPLLKASSAWAALDMKQVVRLALTIDFAAADQAVAGEKALEEVRKLAHGLIAQGMKELQDDEARATKRPVMGLLEMPNHFGPVVGKAALKYVEATLNGLVVKTEENTLRTSLNLSEFFPANADVLLIMAFAGIAQSSGSYYASGRSSNERDEIPYYIRENFDRISAALQAYHADKGSFPPAALYDKDGKPLLSWRVLILPYMEQRPGDLPAEGYGQFGVKPMVAAETKPEPGNANVQTFADLYQKFKLDEPWDSLHNKKLIERMPRQFRVEFSANNWQTRTDWKTGIQVFSGLGTLFPGKEAVGKGQVRDGVESTIAVVFRDDQQNAVVWTKPADIPFAANKQLPKLFNAPSNVRSEGPPKSPGIFVIMADGQSRRLPPDFAEKDFKGLITIAGGESVKLPEPPRKNEAIPQFK